MERVIKEWYNARSSTKIDLVVYSILLNYMCTCHNLLCVESWYSMLMIQPFIMLVITRLVEFRPLSYRSGKVSRMGWIEVKWSKKKQIDSLTYVVGKRIPGNWKRWWWNGRVKKWLEAVRSSMYLGVWVHEGLATIRRQFKGSAWQAWQSWEGWDITWLQYRKSVYSAILLGWNVEFSFNKG